MPRPDASADPLGAVPEPSFSQNSNSNHSSSAGVPTTTDTSVMRSQSLDSKSSSLLQLIAENIDRSVRGRTPSTDLWLRYPLSSDGLGALQDLIRENPHWNDKVRYDYFPRTSIFVLRMPASFEHESSQEGFCRLLERSLRRLCEGDPVKEAFAEEICDDRHSAIGEGRIGMHSPDAQFGHVEAQHPGVILEVAFSQKSKALPELAHIYITEGIQGTNLVVGLDHDDGRSKKIVLKTWRPHLMSGDSWTIDHRCQEFRSHDGNPVPGSNLQIAILDLAPKSLVPESLRDKFIVISSEEFCHYVNTKDRCKEIRVAKTGKINNIYSGMRYCPPPASLDSDTTSEDDEESLEILGTAHEEKNDGD